MCPLRRLERPCGRCPDVSGTQRGDRRADSDEARTRPWGIAYADPLGAHDRLTDAIHGELERLRVLADEGTTSNARIDTAHRPLAADGEGPTE
ncbi:hypothetical protein [Halovenus salina]|uniref:Uncharacterized protein n=1 Tax=Halovenus salina TaxID=1510225 RepID=A0ABD5VYY2_9EURY